MLRRQKHVLSSQSTTPFACTPKLLYLVPVFLTSFARKPPNPSVDGPFLTHFDLVSVILGILAGAVCHNPA